MTHGQDPEGDNKGEAEEGRQRKERVLHTRVSAVLEEELKRLAGNLRVPVSNVVRTILEDAVEKIDEVGRYAEGEIRNVADQLEKHRDLLRSKAVTLDDEPEDAQVEKPAAAPAEPAAQDESPRSEPTAPEAEPAERSEAREEVGAADDDQSSGAALEGVVGFQPLLLARADQCALCRQPLAAGKEAFVGVRDDGGPRVIVGRECLPFAKD